MLILKIDVTKLDKSYFFEGKNGAKYADLIVFENREPDKYNNTHIVYQGLPKEARDAGKKGNIVGNGQQKGGSGGQKKQQPKPADDNLDW